MKDIQKIDFRYNNGAVALYAKAPVLGKVKTRIQAALGEQRALSLHKALIQYVFSNITEANLCPIQLWVADEQDPQEPHKLHHDYFLSFCNKTDIYNQKGANLGAKMAMSARQVLKSKDYVVIIGSDCAAVNADYLEQALRALEAGDEIVIGPAEDGGYVLLGLRVVPECLFADMPWGEADLMAKTRENLRAAGLAWRELKPCWDVDRPEDLPRLASLEPRFPEY